MSDLQKVTMGFYAHQFLSKADTKIVPEYRGVCVARVFFDEVPSDRWSGFVNS